MRVIGIFCVLSLLVTGPVGCKKKPGSDAKKDAPGAMQEEPGDMDPMSGKQGRGVGAMAATPAEPAEPARPAEPKVEVPKDQVPEGVLTEVTGTVEVKKFGETEFKAAAAETKLNAKDSVRVGKDGQATVALWDNSSIELTPETAVRLDGSEAIKDPAPSVTVMAGAARFEVHERTEGQGPFAIYTPSAVVSVQGTTLAVGVGLSGSARIGVEAGKVAVTPVAKADAAPTPLAAGKALVLPLGQTKATITAYKAADAGWDAWLEQEDNKGVKVAAELAKQHSTQVDQATQDTETLEGAEDKAQAQGEQLQKQVLAAEQAKKVAEYKKLQPRFEDNLEARAAVSRQLRLAHSRRAAHAYLLGLMNARIHAGVYQVPKPVQLAVLREFSQAETRRARRRVRGIERGLRRRKQIQRWRRAYFTHHAQGRVLAPKYEVKVPAFYAGVKLRRRLRRPRPVIVGWRGPVFHQPQYRGKVLRVKKGQRVRRAVGWHQDKQWRARRQARLVKSAARRQVWRKAVVEKRRKRWQKRPRIQGIHRGWRGGMQPGGPMGMRPGQLGIRPGMGPMRFGMGPIHPGMGPMRFGMGPIHPGMGPMRFGMGPIQPGMGPMRFDRRRGMRFGMRRDMR
ncbi:MAG: FecR domain-containing protein [bacterium]